MRRWFAAIAASFALACAVLPAFAQWQVPTDTVPRGRGAGVTGFATSNVSIDSSDRMTVSGANVATLGVVSTSFTQVDSASWAQAFSRIGANLNAAGGGGAGSANQQGINVQINVTGATSSAANYEKAAIFAVARTADPSSGGINRDAVGIDGRGYIASTNATGRAWGSVFWAEIQSGGSGDGLLVGSEIDVYNNGTAQSAVDTTTSKYGLTIYAYGAASSTAAIRIGQGTGSSAKWYKMIYADPAHIEAGGTFLQLLNKFSVDVDGFIVGQSLTSTGDVLTTNGRVIVTVANTNALAVGANGTTNPVLQVNSATASVATGVSITGAAAASRVALAVISSGTNEGIDIDAKGSGTIRFGNSSTGNIVMSRHLALTASGTSGALGATIAATQTSPNSSDTNDIAFNVAYTLTANSATNQLVSRAFYFQATNNLTGGGTLSNLRTVDIVLNSNASTTTTDASAIYIEAGTAAGTVTTGYGIQINSVLGTTKWGIFDSSGGNWQSAGSIKSVGATSGIGYATGAGGTVTQLTNKATAVTLNKVTGAITMNNAALAAATIVSFTLNNSAIAATDHVVASHESGGTTGAYTVNCRATGAGTAACDVRNNTAGSLSEAIVIRFSVIKSVNAFLRDPANDNRPMWLNEVA